MRRTIGRTGWVLLLLAGWVCTPSAYADNGTDSGERVPVPDVRGKTEAEALRLLRQSRLDIDLMGQVSAEELEEKYGVRYGNGVVFQQSPPASGNDRNLWVPAGTRVGVRVVVAEAEEGPRTAIAIDPRYTEEPEPPSPPEPAEPAEMPAPMDFAPALRTPQRALPAPPQPQPPAVPIAPAPRADVPPQPMPPTVSPPTVSPPTVSPPTVSPRPAPRAVPPVEWDRTVPPRPTPPYALPDAAPRAPRLVRTPPIVPTPRTAPQPRPPLDVPPIDAPPLGLPPLRPGEPSVPPTPLPLKDRIATPVTNAWSVESWHVRALGWGGFWFGDDSAEGGIYAGGEVGYASPSGFGVDVFYRLTTGRFDRVLPTGTVHDGGDWHVAGLKVTYEFPFGAFGRITGWLGLGGAYAFTSRYVDDDDGWGGFAEAGLGFRITSRLGVRLGANLHGIYTSAARADPTVGSERWLWLLAPTLGIQFDL